MNGLIAFSFTASIFALGLSIWEFWCLRVLTKFTSEQFDRHARAIADLNQALALRDMTLGNHAGLLQQSATRDDVRELQSRIEFLEDALQIKLRGKEQEKAEGGPIQHFRGGIGFRKFMEAGITNG